MCTVKPIAIAWNTFPNQQYFLNYAVVTTGYVVDFIGNSNDWAWAK